MMVIVSAIKMSSQRPSGLQKHGSDTHEISAVDTTLLAEGDMKTPQSTPTLLPPRTRWGDTLLLHIQ